MKVLVLGATGQVGWELERACQPFGEVVALDRVAADLSEPARLPALLQGIKPDVIFNAAAYTAVDVAETEEAAATLINGTAVGVLGEQARLLGALILHLSTDYVFDGSKPGPYLPGDSPAPISAYGRSKLVGERALADAGCDYLCLRTSWVYAARGKNFLRTVLRLATQREELRIVADQVGAPTSARLIAEAMTLAAGQSLHERRMGQFSSATLHLTASGSTSWHGFASAIVDAAQRNGRFGEVVTKRVTPIATEEYPLPARRPRNSRLDCTDFERRFGLRLPDWRTGLALTLAEVQ